MSKPKLRTFKNHILFQFEDEIRSDGNKLFREKTASGFFIPSSPSSSAKEPRWGVVLAVGEDCTTIETGMRVLIEPLAWTNGIKVEEETIWKTDESKILMYEADEDELVEEEELVEEDELASE